MINDLSNFTMEFNEYYTTDFRLPSKYKDSFLNEEFDMNSFGACSFDSNNNVLIRNTYMYCTEFNSDYTECNAFNQENNYFVYNSNDNHLYIQNINNQDLFNNLESLNCSGFVQFNDNYIEDLMYLNKSNEILLYSFYLLIPILLVLFLIKVFRKGIH